MASKVFEARLECPECEEEFEGVWIVNLIDLQQLDEAPKESQRCSCGCVMEDVPYPGWTFYGEAG